MMLVVIAAAAVGGARAALTAVVLGVLAGEFFFAPPFESLHVDLRPDVISLVVFAGVGAVVAILIGELAQLAGEQASSRRVEAALRRIATLVASGVPADELFAAVCAETGELLDAGQTTMNRYESNGTIICIAGWSRTGDAVPLGARLQLGGRNLTTIVAQTGRPARKDSYSDASGAVGEVATQFGYRSAVGAPVVVQGRLWGVLLVASVSEQLLAPDTETRLASFTELVATAISNAENLTELRASRARIVAAADRARKQIERDLHDGAQQDLVSLTFALRGAQTDVGPGLGKLEGELAHIAEGLVSVQDNLREIARGIHPAILAEGGLASALKVLARRCTVPVQLDVRISGRLPDRVEVAAYYVVAEALTNAAKHANASVVEVDAEAAGRVLHLCVRDDGSGGADPVRGSGLVGLNDRVEALGGTITIQSPAGEGTSLHAALPFGG